MTETTGPPYRDGEADPELAHLDEDEKDQFIRGILAAQAWAKTLRMDDPSEMMEAIEEHDELAEEFDKLILDEEHEFGRAVADQFGIPYHPADGSIKLGQPYGKRYKQAWVDLGVEPSRAEKIAHIVTLGVLGRDE